MLFHSLVWLYLDEAVRERILAALESAGATATETSPLAWLRYEQDADDKGRCNLDLRLWPDGKERRLAYGGHHNTPVTVLSASRRS